MALYGEATAGIANEGMSLDGGRHGQGKGKGKGQHHRAPTVECIVGLAPVLTLVQGEALPRGGGCQKTEGLVGGMMGEDQGTGGEQVRRDERTALDFRVERRRGNWHKFTIRPLRVTFFSSSFSENRNDTPIPYSPVSFPQKKTFVTPFSLLFLV